MTDRSHLKLGKKPGTVVDRRTLKLASYIDVASLPEIPEHADASRVPDWGMLGNDRVGDCGPAACAHLDMAVDRRTRNHEARVTEADVIDLYSRVSGYNPQTGANDNGVYTLDLLNEWRRNGLAGERITAFAEVDHTDQHQMRVASFLFGGIILAFALPKAAQRMRDWTAPATINSADPSWQPGSWGGHLIYSNGFFKAGQRVVTWGEEIHADNFFIADFCDEAWAVVTPDWIKRNGKSPRGVAVADLLADLKAVTK